MNPNMFALTAVLFISPIMFVVSLAFALAILKVLQVLLVLALSRDDEERREALLGLTGTLKRR